MCAAFLTVATLALLFGELSSTTGAETAKQTKRPTPWGASAWGASGVNLPRSAAKPSWKDPSTAARAAAREAWSKDVSWHVLRAAESSYKRMMNSSAQELGKELLAVMGPVGPKCRDFEAFRWHTAKVGEAVSGEHKFACGLSSTRGPCTVISLGSNNDWAFESWVHEHTPCRIETFDCTLSETTIPPKWISSRVRFHQACPSGTTHVVRPNLTSPTSARGLQRDWPLQFVDWATLSANIKLTESPAMLKMDIERSEYEFFHSLMAGPKGLLPKQIVFEIHPMTRHTRSPEAVEESTKVTTSRRAHGALIFGKLQPWYSRVETLSAVATLFQLLWQTAGYTIVHVGMTGKQASHGCFEVLLVRPHL